MFVLSEGAIDQLEYIQLRLLRLPQQMAIIARVADILAAHV